MEKISSRLSKGYNMYRVIKSTKEIETLNGKVIKCGKIGFAFKSTSQGIMCCVAKFDNKGKGSYKPVLKNNKVVISTGKLTDVFSSAERVVVAKKIASAHLAGRKEGMKAAKERTIRSARSPLARRTATRTSIRSAASRRPVRSGAIRPEVLNKPLTSARKPLERRSPVQRPSRPLTNAAQRPAPKSPVRKPITSARTAVMNANRQTRQAIRSANEAKRNEAQLRSMHEAEERQRLFQSSQRQISEEKQEIKSNNTRNAETLAKMYKGMF